MLLYIILLLYICISFSFSEYFYGTTQFIELPSGFSSMNTSIIFIDNSTGLYIKPLTNNDKYLLSNGFSMNIKISCNIQHFSNWNGTDPSLYYKLEWSDSFDFLNIWNEIQPISGNTIDKLFHTPSINLNFEDEFKDINMTLRVRFFQIQGGIESLTSEQPSLIYMNYSQRVLQKTLSPSLQYHDYPRWLNIINRPDQSWILYSYYEENMNGTSFIPPTIPIKSNESIACFSRDVVCLIQRFPYVIPVATVFKKIYIRQLVEGKYWSDLIYFNLTTQNDPASIFYSNDSFWNEIIKRRNNVPILIDSDDNLMGLSHIPLSLQIVLILSFILGSILGCCSNWSIVESLFHAFVIETLEMIPKKDIHKFQEVDNEDVY